MADYYWTSTSSTDASVGANWTKASDGTTGTAPTSGDNAYVVPVTGLTLAAIGATDMNTVTLATLTIGAGFTAAIGTTTAYWKISATKCYIHTPNGGSGTGSGSGRIKINFGTVQTTVYVYGSASVATESAQEPIRLKGSHASNAIYVLGGRVGWATDIPAETGTLSEFDVSGQSSYLNLGAGCALTTGNQIDGHVNINSALTTFTQSGGVATTTGTGAITTVSAGGTFYGNSTGTITTLNLYGTGTANFSGNPASRTITTLNHYKGGKLMFFAANPAHLTISTYNKLQGGILQLI